MIHTSELRIEARRLREVEGLPLREIARRLRVSYTTARRWTLDIELSTEQESALTAMRAHQLAQASSIMAERFRSRRQAWQTEGRARARMQDPIHQAACFLYWAEGSKTRNSLSIANSDVNLLRFFCHFLREEFGLPSDRFTFRLQVYTGNGLSISQIEDYWLKRLELPRTALRTHSLNNRPAPTSGTKRNKLPYGVGTLVVTKSTSVIQHIYGAIQEYADFEEPAWLDL